MPKVVVTEFMDKAALKDFGAAFDVTYAPDLVDDRPALLAAVTSADGLIVRNRTQVDAPLLAAAPRLRVVGRLGVGLDNIDLAACASRNITVAPATGANAEAVAEYVIAAILILIRGAYAARAEIGTGGWPRAALGQGGEIAGKSLGLIGLGTIAQSVAAKARALNMNILAHDPHLPADHPAWGDVRACALPELLASADAISLHIPLTAETRALIDAAALAQMKPRAILINTSRGGIVDETALATALHAHRLAGAALDVFATEPPDPSGAASLAAHPNVILTPHIAGVTTEANHRVSHMTVANVKNALA